MFSHDKVLFTIYIVYDRAHKFYNHYHIWGIWALDKEQVKISPVQKIALPCPPAIQYSGAFCKEKLKRFPLGQLFLFSLKDLKYVYAYICQMLDD